MQKRVLYDLDESGRTKGNGNVMVLFPEETTYWQTKGEGQAAGFRFIVGKPNIPLNVVCAGFVTLRGLYELTSRLSLDLCDNLQRTMIIQCFCMTEW
jgi:hypothetical protein